MKHDPTIDEIRKIRQEISRRFGNDPKRIIEYYIQLQKERPNRLIFSSNARQKKRC